MLAALSILAGLTAATAVRATMAAPKLTVDSMRAALIAPMPATVTTCAPMLAVLAMRVGLTAATAVRATVAAPNVTVLAMRVGATDAKPAAETTCAPMVAVEATRDGVTAATDDRATVAVPKLTVGSVRDAVTAATAVRATVCDPMLAVLAMMLGVTVAVPPPAADTGTQMRRLKICHGLDAMLPCSFSPSMRPQRNIQADSFPVDVASHFECRLSEFVAKAPVPRLFTFALYVPFL